MIIDLSKLSPMNRRVLCDIIRRKVGDFRREIDTDLAHWPNQESPTYKEMEGWRNACTDVESQALKGM